MINLNEIIKTSLKNQNLLKANLFRMVKSKLETTLNAKNRKDRKCNDEDVLNAIKKEYKEIKEEIDANWKLDPPDSTILKALSAKLSYLDILLPKEDPIEEAVVLIKDYLLATNNTNFGAIMGFIKKSGKNFNMKQVAEKIKEII